MADVEMVLRRDVAVDVVGWIEWGLICGIGRRRRAPEVILVRVGDEPRIV